MVTVYASSLRGSPSKIANAVAGDFGATAKDSFLLRMGGIVSPRLAERILAHLFL